MFRNRVFHHKPIWRRDLAKLRSDILEMISWINLDGSKLVEALDRVPEVLQPGFRRELRARIYHVHRECR